MKHMLALAAVAAAIVSATSIAVAECARRRASPWRDDGVADTEGAHDAVRQDPLRR